MRSAWRKILGTGLSLGIFAVAGIGGGCVVHAQGPGAQVEFVDVQGYHHRGYYDDHHDWHGGYYDQGHAWHDDAHDWHQ